MANNKALLYLEVLSTTYPRCGLMLRVWLAFLTLMVVSLPTKALQDEALKIKEDEIAHASGSRELTAASATTPIGLDKPSDLPQCPIIAHQKLCGYSNLSFQAIIEHRRCHLQIGQEGVGLADFDNIKSFEGLPIERVIIHRYDVFDRLNPNEDSRFYQALNKAHVVTQTSVIRSQLLFKVGDLYAADRAEESARILRSRRYFSSAVIIPVMCGDQLTMLVATQDAWSLEPEISASRKGGENNTAFALTEDNLFGTGSEIALGYESDAERDRFFVNFFSPHVLNSPYAVSFGYGDTSDGEDFSAALVRPFISLLTESSYGIGLTQQNFSETIDLNEIELTEYQRETRRVNMFYGRAFEISSKRSQRWMLGASQLQDRFGLREDTQSDLPRDERTNFVWGEYSFIENDYSVLENFNFIGQLEDLQIGSTGFLRIGFSPSSWNDDDVPQYPFEFSYSDSYLKENLFINLSTTGQGSFSADEAARSHLTVNVGVNSSYAIDPANRVNARYRIGFTENVRPHEQLLLGGDSGMRGYPLEFQRSRLQSILTIDRRLYTDWHWFNIARVGWIVFADIGMIHKAPDDRLGLSYRDIEENELLADVGFGMRLNSSKTKTNKVLHIDIAFPVEKTEETDTFQLTLTAQSRF